MCIGYTMCIDIISNRLPACDERMQSSEPCHHSYETFVGTYTHAAANNNVHAATPIQGIRSFDIKAAAAGSDSSRKRLTLASKAACIAYSAASTSSEARAIEGTAVTSRAASHPPTARLIPASTIVDWCIPLRASVLPSSATAAACSSAPQEQLNQHLPLDATAVCVCAHLHRETAEQGEAACTSPPMKAKMVAEYELMLCTANGLHVAGPNAMQIRKTGNMHVPSLSSATAIVLAGTETSRAMVL